MKIEPLIAQLAASALSSGGRALLVGGAVRDSLLGMEPKDQDVELYGIPEKDVEPFLQSTGTHLVRVGRSFPVWKVWTDDMGQGKAVDVALPRREMKTGPRHTDFSVVLDPFMPFHEAAARRDFTINAIGLDPLTEELLDPHGGAQDIRDRRLKHVSAHFAEDPLRVMRGAQFCARFGLTPDPATIAFCRQLTPEHLPPERLGEEWGKLLLKGQKPSAGLKFLRDCDWVKHFPEINALIGVQQDPVWHPEGDTYVHTLHCLDAFATRRTGDEAKDLRVGLAVLCHDFGKPKTAGIINGRWTAHGHEAAGEEPTRSFLNRLNVAHDVIADVVPLVTTHMTPKHLFKQAAHHGHNVDGGVRRLAMKVKLDNLATVCWCDDSGRPPKPQSSPASDWLLATATRLEVATKKPERMVLGRHLVAEGYQPGPHFRPILESVMERQLNGEFADAKQAVDWVLTHPALQTAPRLPISVAPPEDLPRPNKSVLPEQSAGLTAPARDVTRDAPSTNAIEQRNGRLFSNGQDVGMLETTLKGDTLEIARLYIKPEFQRQGIGKQVIPFLLDANPTANRIEAYPLRNEFWLKQKPDGMTTDGAFLFDRGQHRQGTRAAFADPRLPIPVLPPEDQPAATTPAPPSKAALREQAKGLTAAARDATITRSQPSMGE